MIYIADTSLDYITGYSIHVMKSVDNISKFTDNTNLYVPQYNTSEKNLIKKYNLLNRKKIKITKSKFKNHNSSFLRIFFGFEAALFSRHKKEKILTRSIWSSIFMIFFNINHILEIHSISKGLGSFLLYKLGLINSENIKKIIVINKELIKYLNLNKKKYLILPDAVDLSNFKYKKKKRFNSKNILYYGSFFEGRGIELIYKLAIYFKKINFVLVGKDNKILNIPKLNNIKVKKKVEYSKIPDILKKYDFVLMPYETKVYVNAKKLDTSEYMSPLKMFETLAMGNIILSSNLKILKKILKNNINSLIVEKNTFEDWKKLIKSIGCKKNLHKISKNAIKTAQMYTWEKRVKKILDCS